MQIMIYPFVLRTLASLDTSLVRTEREGERERWEHADASTRRSTHAAAVRPRQALARARQNARRLHAHARTASTPHYETPRTLRWEKALPRVGGEFRAHTHNSVVTGHLSQNVPRSTEPFVFAAGLFYDHDIDHVCR